MECNIISTISNYLGFEESQILEVSKKAPRTYKKYYINKKKNGTRTIYHPSKKTKSLQYALIENFFRDFQVHECSYSYIRGKKSPLLSHATVHSNFQYSVRVDFQNFFPSIKPEDLFLCFNHFSNEDCLSEKEKIFLQDALFIKLKNGDWGLAIGAPSSPIISNIIMFKLDEKLSGIASSISTDSVYTRYADDLIFSTNQKGTSKKFVAEVNKLLKSTKSPSLKVNKAKTIFSSKGTKRRITGLMITHDGKISLGRGNKRFIKKLINDFKFNQLKEPKLKYLRGYFSFILDNEPDFFNRLVIKYGDSIINRILSN